MAATGFALLAFIEWLLGHDHRSALGKALPAALLLSDSLHNVGDGAAIVAAFLLATRVGVGFAVAVIAHEVPQEIGDHALLRRAGWRRGRALNALAGVQLTAVLGALNQRSRSSNNRMSPDPPVPVPVPVPAARNGNGNGNGNGGPNCSRITLGDLGVVVASGLTQRTTGPVLSLAAGTFLYIGATDVLPELKTGRSFGERCERMIGLLAGIGTIVLASALELG